MKFINCLRCWKEIQLKWPRKYCIKCRNLVDKEIQREYIEKNREEIRRKQRERMRRASEEKKARESR